MIHPEAPLSVRIWARTPPDWLEVLSATPTASSDDALVALDDGERAAIALALSLKADLILMDDREGTVVARQKGFVVTGTLGILDLASRKQMVDLAEAFTRLKATNFRYPAEIMDALLAENKKRTGK